ncbi:MAG TPA: glycosyltransferase family 39 protein [Vicinamibacterales bacterium]|nr:glycosyltransferase family 39 protein [Vicinamibacterales bacterium]
MRRQATVWIVVLACALRLPGLWTDFWLDEIWALDNVDRVTSAVGIFTDIHHDSNHWLISLWMYVLGQDAPFWLYRLPSFLAGVAAVVIAGRLADVEGVNRTLAMLLVAVSFPLGFYASEARGYAIASTAALASFLYLLHWLERGRLRWLMLTWASAAVGLLAHLSFVAVLGSTAVFVAALFFARKLSMARVLLPLSVPFALLLGLAIVDLRHLQFGGGPPLDVVGLLLDLAALSIGAPLGHAWTAWLAVAGGAAVLASLAVRVIGRNRDVGSTSTIHLAWVFYASILVVPVATAVFIRPPFLFPRYFLVSLAFVPLLVAGARARVAAPVFRAVIVAMLVLHAASWVSFWRDGRGHYAAALTSLLAAVPQGAVTVGADHAFRTPVVVDFHARRLGPDARRIVLVATDAQFTIVSSPSTPITPALCGACVLVRDDPSSALSGAPWRIYRRSP